LTQPDHRGGPHRGHIGWWRGRERCSNPGPADRSGGRNGEAVAGPERRKGPATGCVRGRAVSCRSSVGGQRGVFVVRGLCRNRGKGPHWVALQEPVLVSRKTDGRFQVVFGTATEHRSGRGRGRATGNCGRRHRPSAMSVQGGGHFGMMPHRGLFDTRGSTGSGYGECNK